MKRAMPLLLLALTAFAQTGRQPKPLTNADVLEMTHSGVPESTIILAIQNTPVNFDVSADGILALHAAGITEPVLNQMLRAATPQRQTGAAFGVATGTFPVKDAAGKTVHFSAWIKTENVQNGYAGLWWRVDGPGEGTETGRRAGVRQLSGASSSVARRTLTVAPGSAERRGIYAMDPVRVRATRREDSFQHQLWRTPHGYRYGLGRLDEDRTGW